MAAYWAARWLCWLRPGGVSALTLTLTLALVSPSPWSHPRPRSGLTLALTLVSSSPWSHLRPRPCPGLTGMSRKTRPGVAVSVLRVQDTAQDRPSLGSDSPRRLGAAVAKEPQIRGEEGLPEARQARSPGRWHQGGRPDSKGPMAPTPEGGKRRKSMAPVKPLGRKGSCPPSAPPCRPHHSRREHLRYSLPTTRGRSWATAAFGKMLKLGRLLWATLTLSLLHV